MGPVGSRSGGIGQIFRQTDSSAIPGPSMAKVDRTSHAEPIQLDVFGAGRDHGVPCATTRCWVSFPWRATAIWLNLDHASRAPQAPPITRRCGPRRLICSDPWCRFRMHSDCCGAYSPSERDRLHGQRHRPGGSGDGGLGITPGPKACFPRHVGVRPIGLKHGRIVQRAEMCVTAGHA